MPEICYIGLGANLGDRRAVLEQAATMLAQSAEIRRASPVFSTPAMMPPGAPSEWDIPYYNAVMEIEWSEGPQALLALLKHIEQVMGRTAAPRWAPRMLDLDLLLFGKHELNEDNLVVPHPGIVQRSFVLDPLLHCAPGLCLPDGLSVLQAARRLSGHQPLWMGILNLTPDSFSDGGRLGDDSALVARLDSWDAAGVPMLDIGAESTRPGATPITPDEEWNRLQPVLVLLSDRYRGKYFRPLISIDTRHAQVAARALEHGPVDIINDVSGGVDPGMIDIIRDSGCDYVLMHNLGVPADPAQVLPDTADALQVVMAWARDALERFAQAGIDTARIIIDPGIGFGKNSAQSLQLLRHAQAFHALPVRLLIGASRKSLITRWTDAPPAARDGFSLGIGVALAQQGVEIIRTHTPEIHRDVWTAYQHMRARDS